MPNWLQRVWLQKILPPASSAQTGNLPAQSRGQQLAAKKEGQLAPGTRVAAPQQQLSNASVIYGMAASALFTVALYFLVTGRWFTGFLVLLTACCFLGFALQLMKTR